MEKMFKQLSMVSLFVASLTSSIAMSASEIPTMLTLYNSETVDVGTGSAIAVLRQDERKVELFTCSRRYNGSLNDSVRITSFFQEEHNCHAYMKMEDQNFIVNKNIISNFQGKPERYVITGSGTNTGIAEVLSDVTTWTIDVNVHVDSTVDLVGARVYHSRFDNPIISTYRDSHKLSGITRFKYTEIGN